MLVHCFICLSARVEFKFMFEFNSLSEVWKPEKEKKRERKRTGNQNQEAAQQPNNQLLPSAQSSFFPAACFCNTLI